MIITVIASNKSEIQDRLGRGVTHFFMKWLHRMKQKLYFGVITRIESKLKKIVFKNDEEHSYLSVQLSGFWKRYSLIKS